MNKILKTGISIFAFAMATTPLSANNEDMLFFCGFQDTAEREKVLVYDLDGLSPSVFMAQLGFSAGTGWILTFLDSNTSTNYFAGSTSSYSPAGQANDWLITKDPIHIPSEGYVLYWKSQALDLEKRDGFSVYISTTGNNPENFTNEAVFHIEEEESGVTGNTDNEWTEHQLTLDEYAGQSIYVAFVNDSYDKNILCLDDITVMKRRYLTLESTLSSYTLENEVQISGIVTATESTVQSFRAFYQVNEAEPVEQEFTNLSIHAGESHSFTFTQNAHLENMGEYASIRMWVEYNETTESITDSIAFLPFEPTHKVVIEEGTGQWCGWCPLGILTFDYLQEKYPDNLVPIAVHNRDEMAIDEYCYALGFSQYPTGRVNRNATTVTPTTADYLFEGPGSFHDALIAALNLLPEADIRITNVEMDADSVVHVSTNTRFCLIPPASTYQIAYVIISNNYVAQGGQVNYLADATIEEYPTFGEFAKGGKYGQKAVEGYAYDDVACGIFPSFSGAAGIFPTEIAIDKTYPHNFDINLKQCININPQVTLAVAALLIDGNDGTIVNADMAHFGDIPDENSIDRQNAGKDNVFFDGQSLILPESCSDVQIYAANGTLLYATRPNGNIIGTGQLPKGIFLYRVVTHSGIITGKFNK